MAEPDPARAAGPPASGDGRRSGPMRVAVAFGHFWWEFLVGDTPELFVGVLIVLGVVALACTDHRLRTAAAFAFPVLVGLLLAGSVHRAGRRRPS